MSAKHFIKDLEDYLIDTELTDTDRKRIEQIFTRHTPDNHHVVIKEVIKEVPKVKIVKEVVYSKNERVVYIDKQTGQFVQPTSDNIKRINSVEEGLKVIYEACNTWRVTYEDITSKSRKKRLCYARYYCFKILYKMGFTLQDIGDMFGGRDHTTVMSGKKEADNILGQKIQPFTMFWENREKEINEQIGELCDKCGKLL